MGKKISMVEGLFLIIIALSFDVFEFFVGLFDGGIISPWIISPFFIFPIGFWLYLSKGMLPLRFGVGSAVDVIPIINMIPLIKTATVISIIMLANNPKLANLKPSPKPTEKPPRPKPKPQPQPKAQPQAKPQSQPQPKAQPAPTPSPAMSSHAV